MLLGLWHGDKKQGVIIFPEAKKEAILRITYQFLWETLLYPLAQWEEIRS
jgi:hypothetical protein